MIYLDNAATTKPSKNALDTYLKYAETGYFNPSAGYPQAVEIKAAMNAARKTAAEIFGADGDVVFTASGTESNNLAFFGINLRKGARVVIGGAEHKSVYEPAMKLKAQGFDVVLCPATASGAVTVQNLLSCVDSNTAFVSVMHINNETGAINDIAALSAAAKKINQKIIFHSDGVQAFCKVPQTLGSVDLYSFSSHKINSVKGAGGLFIKKGLHLSPHILGGGQEGGLRSGTENVGALMAMCAQAKFRSENLNESLTHCTSLKSIFIEKLLKKTDYRCIFEENSDFSPYIASFVSASVRGETMQSALAAQGVLIGTGSACASNATSGRIPAALGLNKADGKGIIRISFAPETGEEKTSLAADLLCNTWTRLSSL
ncbi:MAG: cysteine desulfurase [Christensenellaceae bacterium]|jgi:cysteine desulfurase|nr:cysteine desulfurase [Christensenellaceae bacterium]